MGFRPGNEQWIALLVRLEGEFERSRSELALEIMALVFNAGIVFVLAAFAIKEYRQWGWTPPTQFFSFLCLIFCCLLCFLISRLGLRYVFTRGTVSAFNTWDRLMWSEDLTGLASIVCFSGRGTTSMTLRWPDRKRGMILFDSLKNTVNASVESAHSV